MAEHRGSRTPHYGGMTPYHDGSRTPGAWDPSITNTPGRSSDDSFSMEDGYPATNLTPQTPNSQYASSDHSYSSRQPSSSNSSHADDGHEMMTERFLRK